MNKLIQVFGICTLLLLVGCKQNAEQQDPATTTVTASAPNVSEDSSIIHNHSDIRQLAMAINATSDAAIQSAIDSINDIDIKHWAIAATTKIVGTRADAVSAIKNARVSQVAYIMSSKEDAKTLGSVESIQEPDFKNLAQAYLAPADANKYIDNIKSPSLRNLALSITSTTAQDKLKYANAIVE